MANDLVQLHVSVAILFPTSYTAQIHIKLITNSIIVFNFPFVSCCKIVCPSTRKFQKLEECIAIVFQFISLKRDLTHVFSRFQFLNILEV